MSTFTLTRTSPFTGKTNTMEIPLSEEKFEVLWEAWHSNGVLLQDAFDMLNADQREFIKTGITPQEWEDTFGGKE